MSCPVRHRGCAPGSVLQQHSSPAEFECWSAGDGGQSRLWQPYSDYLVYSVFIALPWMATELAEGTHEGLQALLASVAAYMQLRPRQHQTEMSPFPGAGRGAVESAQDATPLAAHPGALSSDSGGASFLGQVCGGAWSGAQTGPRPRGLTSMLPRNDTDIVSSVLGAETVLCTIV